MWFGAMIDKWKELDILKAEDIARNSKISINYNLRISENNLRSAFGQVDKDGKMQGIGREV